MNLPLFDIPEPVVTEVHGITPRDYQLAAIENTVASWDAGSPGALVRLMTGGGKTIVGSLIIDRWLQRGDNYRALVLAHERQLIWQFADEIQDVLGIRPEIEMSNRRATGNAQVTIASRQTLAVVNCDGEVASRLYKFDNKLNWLIVCDEAHRWARKLKSCAPIIEWFEENPESKRLALTATPERTDKTSLQSLFPTVASDYRLWAHGPCAIKDGWAVPYDQRFVTVEGVDFKELKTVAGDFRDDELENLLNQKEELAKLITPTLELVGNRRTLIFSPSKAMAKNVALQINAEQGCDNAYSLDGTVPEEERKEVYKRHQAGAFQFLSVCGLCREGYNDPGIQAVAIYRPTKSRPLAEQMKGRGCRPLRGIVDGLSTAEERLAAIANSDKPNCLIVDLVGITGLADCASTASLFAEGKPDQVIEWANQLMLKGESDPVRAIARAEEEIEAEKQKAEEARLARLERNRLEREEAIKRARLRAEVRYSAVSVERGQGGAVPSGTGKRMAFGKYKGWPMSAVPEQYLRWIAEQGDKDPAFGLAWFKGQAWQEIKRRERAHAQPIAEPVQRVSPRDADAINRMLMEAR